MHADPLGLDVKASSGSRQQKPTRTRRLRKKVNRSGELGEDIESETMEDDRMRWVLNPPEEQPQAQIDSCGMISHLTDAKRMLASVDKIVEAGNRVSLGEEPEENFVENVKTGRRMVMEKERGVYVVKAIVKSGNRQVKCSIVVDSGASECVMPKAWFPEFASMGAKHGIRFAGANGNDLGNFGRELIEFVPASGFQRRA